MTLVSGAAHGNAVGCTVKDDRHVEATLGSTSDRADALALSARFDVAPTADGVRALRVSVREVLNQWDDEVVAANAAVDVAHELVANAVQHGLPPVTVTLQCTTTVVQVAVTDGSPQPVRRLPYRSGVSERGLGVRLVGQLSHAWGQQDHGPGKLVWATIRRRARTRGGSGRRSLPGR
jgi:anti-sigma regulatory factor (Ser/Thr protein kinase)